MGEMDRSLNVPELKAITYPDYYRRFVYSREMGSDQEEQKELEGEDLPIDWSSEDPKDRFSRQIKRRCKLAMIRWAFLLPYGEDLEKFCLKLLLENVPVDITT